MAMLGAGSGSSAADKTLGEAASLRRMGLFRNALDKLCSGSFGAESKTAALMIKRLRILCEQAESGNFDDQVELRNNRFQRKRGGVVADYISPVLHRDPKLGLIVNDKVSAGTLLLCLNSVATTPISSFRHPTDEENANHEIQIQEAAAENAQLQKVIFELQRPGSTWLPIGGHILQPVPTLMPSSLLELRSLPIFLAFRSEMLVFWPLASIIRMSCCPNTAATVVLPEPPEDPAAGRPWLAPTEDLVLCVRAANDLAKGEALELCHPCLSPLEKYALRSWYAPYCLCEKCRLELRCKSYFHLLPPKYDDEEGDAYGAVLDVNGVETAVEELKLSAQEQKLLRCSYIKSYIIAEGTGGFMVKGYPFNKKELVAAVREGGGCGGFLTEAWFTWKLLHPELDLEKQCKIWFGDKHGGEFFERIRS